MTKDFMPTTFPTQMLDANSRDKDSVVIIGPYVRKKYHKVEWLIVCVITYWQQNFTVPQQNLDIFHFIAKKYIEIKGNVLDLTQLPFFSTEI